MEIAPDGTHLERLGYKDENDAEAWMIRGYNRERQEYQMIDSHFDPEFSRWFREVKVPLVPGKGIPTALYMDIILWKRLEVDEKQLSRVTIMNVHDWDSVFHLHSLFRNRPDVPLGEHFKQTRLFRSRQNLIIQTGMEITGIHLNTASASFSHPPSLAGKAPGAGKNLIAALCGKYGIELNDMVIWGFNVEIDVRYVPPQTTLDN